MAKHSAHRKPVSKAGQKRVSAKIAKLRREGKTASEAAGAAFGMERTGHLGPKGGYVKRKGKKKP